MSEDRKHTSHATRLTASLNVIALFIKLRSCEVLFSDLSFAENLTMVSSKPSPINEIMIAGTARLIEYTP
jgi:hypothetical protein